MNELNLKYKNYKKELLELLTEWVKIPSVYDESTVTKDMPFGKSVTDALSWFETLGKDNNFITKNVDNYAVYIEHGDGNEHIDIFGHCDVVNVGEGWNSNPFEIKLENNKLIGRGVSDNKGPMISCFLAIKMIRDMNIKLNRKVRLIVGGNEESGFKCIKHYYSKEPYGICGFTPDAKFPVLNGEKGAGVIYLKLEINNKDVIVYGGLEHNTIPDKVTIKNIKNNNEFIVKGIGGHSSKPEFAINPIPKSLIDLYNQLNEQWTIDLYKIINEDNMDGKLFGLNKEGKCGILSIVPTKINIENGLLEIVLNTRYPENIEFREIIDSIKKFIDENNICKLNVSGINIKKSNYINKESELVKTLHDIYIKYSGDNESVVRVTSAGSYASEMNNSVIYGCEFLDGSFGNVHKANEFASLEKLELAIAIYAQGIIALCNNI
ncbi:Sapep family Mn(2+)-dependent dipeptidase [Clostridium sp. CCUG 7971]|uniref:Sapep family Mn(2+)-dependent dipeptidase n=1 Tax=Clostridium sp. CCUG 7971 TaxID=2811414 RepID=UPI001ABAD76A|nr:Sapep family Mn(2+)-dependent dipeptidase [Clostridium sp. CCUG 7971]MBO3443503.1 Sapep family Mn(2+)-dependent dipeptidase [Clostridium sp. CCUG 7971]